ncbi:MAG: hypothetical protein M3320_07465 [Actinomycetota bacterium]|nr:hypothetical protein [Actinomycetota bacterium]MDQ5808499.1 hypothetical protein [Actinomycetota bacterium]
MSHWDEDHLPDDLKDVVRRLRDQRPEVSALELDQIKLRAKSRAASSGPQKGFVLKTRLTVALLSLGLVAGGTGGVLAAKGGTPGPPSGSAGKAQYSNGKNCGTSKHDAPGPEKPNQKDCPATAGPKK